MLLEIFYYFVVVLSERHSILAGARMSFVEFLAETHISTILPVMVSLWAMFLIIDKYALLLDADPQQRWKGIMYAIGTLIYTGLFLYNKYLIYLTQETMTCNTFNTNTMSDTKKTFIKL